MIVSIIVAIGNNREIGLNNKLLWHIPTDLKHFKSITKGHCVVMGRKTYESIGRPLPKRINVVLSRNKNLSLEGCEVLSSLEEAIDYARSQGEDELFIIGGERIYAEGLAMADKIYLTRVDYSGEADAFFPEFDLDNWRVVEQGEQLEENGARFSFQTLEHIT